MNREEIDKLWNKAIREAIEEGCLYTRYHFAELVAAAEREACAKLADKYMERWTADAIRARGQA